MGHAGPIRRTPRPKDRKQQIIRAAADLFHRHGYANVSTTQIAEAVGITAGALYRHFAGKQELLAESLGDVFDRSLELVSTDHAMDLDTMVKELAVTATKRPDLGILWSRESRHLDDDRLEQVRRRFFAFLARLAAEVRVRRPELSPEDAEMLSFCGLAVLTSISYHRAVLSESATAQLLRRAVMVVLTTPMGELGTSGTQQPATRPSGLTPHSRREAIQLAATHLFHERGYQAVRMNDIGAELDITSTAVYKYFPSKSDLLSAVIARGAEPLRLGLSRALANASTPEEGLHGALDSYIRFGLSNHDLVGVLVAEATNLPDALRQDLRRSQHDYVSEWTQLLVGARHDIKSARAKYVVHMVLTIVNDVIRTEHLRNRVEVAAELHLLGQRLLAMPA